MNMLAFQTLLGSQLQICCLSDMQFASTFDTESSSLHLPASIRAKVRTMLKAESVQAVRTSAVRPGQLNAFTKAASTSQPHQERTAEQVCQMHDLPGMQQ